ncbi:hypothetical protein GGTG_05548 [Gaeumannomyces tritici R3-111a-1]|uniref:Uncharacterized protein n=1 Tax=Gaeumannomyces tritici (strain R3-111a-1) TaxID=644352 RepID=J3NW83_GAET3|nr:hypothetical protein GGTG_05548 [Gaeumannomyces tritici R3-111a-1]EJT75615.1 hypothetical protein GGTG_05548 [Gaeumannomyces tritici R3-111a-1]
MPSPTVANQQGGTLHPALLGLTWLDGSSLLGSAATFPAASQSEAVLGARCELDRLRCLRRAAGARGAVNSQHVDRTPTGGFRRKPRASSEESRAVLLDREAFSVHASAKRATERQKEHQRTRSVARRGPRQGKSTRALAKSARLQLGAPTTSN